MPFKSLVQSNWAHTPAGTKALGGAGKVKEWEKATDYKHLPDHTAKKKALHAIIDKTRAGKPKIVG